MTTAWTSFMDMHSGGGCKEEPYEYIYIEAPKDEARVIFYNRFGHNPNRVTCTCCGDDYSIDEEPSLARSTAYQRNCSHLETPRGADGRYQKPADPWFDEHYYVEPDEEADAVSRGFVVLESISRRIGREHGSDYGRYLTVEEYVAQESILVIRADEIKPEERAGRVPEQGYVWVK